MEKISKDEENERSPSDGQLLFKGVPKKMTIEAVKILAGAQGANKVIGS